MIRTDGRWMPGRRALVLAMLCVLAPATALAQAWPHKPIRWIVPYPPGGGTDIVARLLAVKMSAALGQQVIVDNRPGASTIIGTDAVAKSAPDGYTIGLVTDSHAINPSFFPKLPYDSQKDFQAVRQLVSVPLMLVAHPSLKVTTVPELIAAAKANPGKINYASIGNGSPHHLAMEWLKTLAGIQMNHIPYKGVAPALSDVVAGQVDLMFTGTSSARPYVKDKRLVALGTSEAKRLAAFPDIPAVAEGGPPDFDVSTWYGVVAPAGTPRPIVQRLQQEIGAALAQPDVQERLATLGVVPTASSSPEEFAAFLNAQAVKLAQIIRATGVKPD